MENSKGFEQFWRAYPRRVGKLAAIKAWNKIRPNEALVLEMLSALAWQVQTPGWREGFIPHPASWLNAGRWMDEPFHAEPERKGTTRKPSIEDSWARHRSGVAPLTDPRKP